MRAKLGRKRWERWAAVSGAGVAIAIAGVASPARAEPADDVDPWVGDCTVLPDTGMALCVLHRSEHQNEHRHHSMRTVVSLTNGPGWEFRLAQRDDGAGWEDPSSSLTAVAWTPLGGAGGGQSTSEADQSTVAVVRVGDGEGERWYLVGQRFGYCYVQPHGSGAVLYERCPSLPQAPRLP